VAVYLKGDFSQYSFPPAIAPVPIDQSGCVYSPHVVAIMTGEPLQVTNSDATTTHNVNPISTYRQGWNQTLAPGSALIERTFAPRRNSKSREVQHTPVDEVLCGGAQTSLFSSHRK
jgi:hypothetical protein